MMLPQVKPDLVVFDFDDTLADHWPETIRLFKDVFKNIKDPNLQSNLDDCVLRAEQSAHKAHNRIQNLLTFCAQLNNPEITGLVYHNFSNAAQNLSRVNFYHGAMDFVRDFRDAEIPCQIVSLSEEDFIRGALRTHGVEEFFESVIGKWSAKSSILGSQAQSAFERFGPRAQVWFIGDGTADFADMGDFPPERYPSISRIAAFPGSFAALNHPEMGTGRAYVIEDFDRARQELAPLLRPESLTPRVDLG